RLGEKLAWRRVSRPVVGADENSSLWETDACTRQRRPGEPELGLAVAAEVRRVPAGDGLVEDRLTTARAGLAGVAVDAQVVVALLVLVVVLDGLVAGGPALLHGLVEGLQDRPVQPSNLLAGQPR